MTVFHTRVREGVTHSAEVTLMTNGNYRAECSCGWWKDARHSSTAVTHAKHHLKPIRQVKGRTSR